MGAEEVVVDGAESDAAGIVVMDTDDSDCVGGAYGRIDDVLVASS